MAGGIGAGFAVVLLVFLFVIGYQWKRGKKTVGSQGSSVEAAAGCGADAAGVTVTEGKPEEVQDGEQPSAVTVGSKGNEGKEK
ncbi:8cda47e0-1295-473e-8d71-cd0866a021a2 [Thermothielavioides terrestris]|jgi:hypothetical protein|uniref:Uncharacterized protein n=2 Tax=Thermothielavioides terrestris TaxID=2587410 RepID=G2QWG7_THETT|nr:uncharacterized protein THITE_2111045 [Thermothielavioides terrestris NRRL 8126]AEO64742.1 hypothetical protein THITE_2111045 [Thermothielavioides terrestris NRRL 8126]SPQ26408.1 8cda47e0-1295-473e-8d71-cd0866a021a2 [Thermothielavioides terrestris]